MRFLLATLIISGAVHLLSAQPQVTMLARAESQLTKMDTAGAIRTFRETLNRYPDSYPAALRLTEIFYLKTEFQQAVQYSFVTEDILNRYLDSVQVNGIRTDFDRNRLGRYQADLSDIHMLKGKIRLKQNRPVDALHELNLAVEHSERPADVYIDIGLAHISLGEFNAADKAFKASLEIEPDNKGALFNMGNMYYAQEKYDSAKYYYTATMDLYPDLKWPLLYLGNIATSKMAYDQALTYYTRYLELDSTSHEVYFRRAVIYSETRQWDQAVEDWNAVIQLDSTDSEAFRNRGLAYFQQQEYKNALSDFSHALTIHQEPYTFINRGYTYYLLREYDKALADLNTGLQELEDYPLGYYLRALTHLQMRNKEQACADLAKARETGFTEEDIRDKKLLKACR